jgi:hypothetical protein
MRESGVRELTVGYRVQGRTRTLRSRDADGRVLASRQVSVLVSCPQIRLGGFWLEAAGFHVGDRVTVRVADGQIVIGKEVRSDEMAVPGVGPGQVDGEEAGVGGLSLVEGRVAEGREGV